MKSLTEFLTDLTIDPVTILDSYYTDAEKTNLVKLAQSVAKIDTKYYQSFALPPFAYEKSPHRSSPAKASGVFTCDYNDITNLVCNSMHSLIRISLSAGRSIDQPGLIRIDGNQNPCADPQSGESRCLYQFISLGQTDAHLSRQFLNTHCGFLHSNYLL